MVEGFAPIGVPVVVDGRGYAWLPVPGGQDVVGWHLKPGLRVAWAPLPGNTGALLHMLAGIVDDPAYETDGLAITLTRDGLRRLIADLQSVEAQLEVAR